MLQVIHTLWETKNHPIWDIGDFVHPTHAQGKKMYPLASQSLLLGKKDTPLAEITENGMKIWDSFFSTILDHRSSDSLIHYQLSSILGWWPLMPKSRRLTENIHLNHFGVCTPVDNLDKRVREYVEAVKNTTHHIYEDPEGREEHMRWLFVGDAESDDPLFEIVLPNPEIQMRPHFQIDVDTDVSQEQIEAFFPPDFFDWKLDVPELWTVLQMATLWNIWGYDIRLGIWNNKRSKQEHRKTMIRLR